MLKAPRQLVLLSFSFAFPNIYERFSIYPDIFSTVGVAAGRAQTTNSRKVFSPKAASGSIGKCSGQLVRELAEADGARVEWPPASGGPSSPRTEPIYLLIPTALGPRGAHGIVGSPALLEHPSCFSPFKPSDCWQSPLLSPKETVQAGWGLAGCWRREQAQSPCPLGPPLPGPSGVRATAP